MASSRESIAVQYVTACTFACEPDLLFDCWTLPQHLVRWWLTDDYSMEVLDNDLREGGRILYRYKTTAKDTYISVSLYEQVVKPRRLVILSSFSNEAGDLVPPYKFPEFPRVLYLVLTFKAVEGGTHLTIEAMPYEGTARENANFLAIHPVMTETYETKFTSLKHYLSNL